MSSDLDKKQENQVQSEKQKRFYESLAQGQFARALEISKSGEDFGSDIEKIVVAILRLKLGLQKYVG
jgi:hypothetical protein